MNFIDMVIITIICFCMIRGVFRGISSELSSIIAVVGGFYSAYLFYPQLVGRLPRQIPVDGYEEMVCFAIIFCAVYISVSLLGLLIKYALGITMLGWIDRLLGAGFGAIKGVLVSSVLVFAIITVLGFQSPNVKQSLLSGYAIQITRFMATATPQNAYHKLESRIHQLRDVWENRKS